MGMGSRIPGCEVVNKRIFKISFNVVKSSFGKTPLLGICSSSRLRVGQLEFLVWSVLVPLPSILRLSSVFFELKKFIKFPFENNFQTHNLWRSFAETRAFEMHDYILIGSMVAEDVHVREFWISESSRMADVFQKCFNLSLWMIRKGVPLLFKIRNLTS